MTNDPLTRQQRYKSMSSNRGKDTKPEILLRHALWQRGFRYRKNYKPLPGKPDIVLRQYAAVIFVHGCFWHHHEDCYYGYTPKSRVEFWGEKFRTNQERDRRNAQQLAERGWRVLTVWECCIKGKAARDLPMVIDLIESWLKSDQPSASIERLHPDAGLKIHLLNKETEPDDVTDDNP